MYGINDDFEALVGEKIVSFHANEGHTSIGFITESGRALAWDAWGDCCSYSWFEHVSGLAHLIGGTVSEIKGREMPGATSDEDHECLQFYGWSIVTDKGYFDIEMRNSSNGYYGGDIHGPNTFGALDLPLVQADF